jgi:hypothetical protein
VQAREREGDARTTPTRPRSRTSPARASVVAVDQLPRTRCGHQTPGVPGDLEDHERDDEADDGITDRGSEGDDDRARDDSERDETIGPSVVAVCDQRGARESATGAESHLGRKFVSGEPDDAGRGKHPQVGQVLRVEEALDGLVQRHARRDENREYDRKTGELLAPEAAKEERYAERDGGQRIAEVVDQVGEQRDRVGEEEDYELRDCGETEDREAEGDRFDTLARANDRAVDETVRVAMRVRVRDRVVVVTRIPATTAQSVTFRDGLRPAQAKT